MGDKYDGVAVDLWSCGCILLFMLAAAPAFSGVPPPCYIYIYIYIYIYMLWPEQGAGSVGRGAQGQ